MASRGSFVVFSAGSSGDDPEPTPPSDLGWLTVSAEGIVGLADSSDEEQDPDYTPIAGLVMLTPTISKPIRQESSGRFLAIAPIQAQFDSNGVLSYEGSQDVRVIAPQWEDLSDTTWKWRAEISPGSGQTWSDFTVSFTGIPGDHINLASLV